MHAITADLYEPRLRWASEALQAMLSAYGPARTVAWARAGDEETKLAALAVFEQVPRASLRKLRRGRGSASARGDLHHGAGGAGLREKRGGHPQKPKSR